MLNFFVRLSCVLSHAATWKKNRTNGKRGRHKTNFGQTGHEKHNTEQPQKTKKQKKFKNTTQLVPKNNQKPVKSTKTRDGNGSHTQ